MTHWSQSELDTLKQIAAEKRFSDVPLMLPGRSMNGARVMARYYGYTTPVRSCRPWTPEEDNIIRTFSHLSPDALSEKLDRTPRAIKKRRYDIGAVVHSEYSIELPNETWAYLAGILDGEGWIGFSMYKGWTGWVLVPQIIVTNTSKELIEFIKQTLTIKTDSKIILRKKDSRYSAVWQDSWQYSVRGRFHVKAILKGVLPFLIVKRDHAQLILSFIDTHEFGKPASVEELKAVYEFRLAHHHGDRRRQKTTQLLGEILNQSSPTADQ